MIIKVMSLWQPWALAMWMGLKQYETRDERAPVVAQLRKYDGWLGIHAAQLRWLQAVDKAFGNDLKFNHAWAKRFIEYANDAPLGREYYGVVGAVCRRGEIHCTHAIRDKLSEQELFFGNYADGRRAIHCPGMIRLPSPIPLRGMQGLFDWRVPLEVESILRLAEVKRD